MVYQTNSRQDTLIKSKGTFIDESEQTVISSIKMFGANIEHSARNNYRPYLMLYGEISAVAFPNGRYQAFFPPTQVHVRYEFSDDELSKLATKGLFYDGFKCPDIIAENSNIEIPMTATARRYELMNNLYVSLDLASKGIYQTNTKECEYIFADYFEEQIPSKLDTKPVEKEEDVIPTFDDDFAAQFAAEFENAEIDNGLGIDGDEFAKEAAQAKHKQALITKEANDLLLKSPAYLREQARLKSLENGKPISKEQSPEVAHAIEESKNSRLIDEDDEFAAFRNAQTPTQSKPIVQPFDAEKRHSISKPQETEEDVILENSEKDASFDYDNTDFGDAFNGELDGVLFNKEDSVSETKIEQPSFEQEDETEIETETNTEISETEQSETSEEKPMSELEAAIDGYEAHDTKESVEEALKNATSTKHNPNAQKITLPDTHPAFDDSMDFN